MVYIVDDEQNVREGFSILLQSSGYKCKSFESAEEFLIKYKKGAGDLLILDLHLNGMNGCDLLKNLDEKGMHLPVIVITAFDEARYRECCREYGVLAYLRKPVDGVALLDLIKYNLESQLSTKSSK